MYTSQIQNAINETNQEISTLNLEKATLQEISAQLESLEKENSKVIKGYTNQDGLSTFLTFLSLIAGVFVGIQVYKLVNHLFFLFALAIAAVAGFIFFFVLAGIIYSIRESHYKEDYRKYSNKKKELEEMCSEQKFADIENKLSKANGKLNKLEKDLHYADLYDMPQDNVSDLCQKYTRIVSLNIDTEFSKKVVSELENAILALDLDRKYAATDILSTAYEYDKAPVLAMTYKVAYKGMQEGSKELKDYIYRQEELISEKISDGTFLADAKKMANALAEAGDSIGSELLNRINDKKKITPSSSGSHTYTGDIYPPRTQSKYDVERVWVPDVSDM